LTCDTNYLLYEGECLSSCPDKTYSDGSACQSNQYLNSSQTHPSAGCSASNCKECDSTKCLACETSFFLYEGGCVDPCPDKAYADGSACYGEPYSLDSIFTHFQDCPTNCKTCDSTKCLTCDTSYLLYKGSCVDSCPARFYSDLTSCIGKHYFRVFFVINPSALACSDNCAECDTDGCEVCDDDYELDTDKKCVVASSKTPSTPSTEEAGSSRGGVSGRVIAAIVCGCLATITTAGWFAFRFKKMKFPFRSKRSPFLFSHHSKI